MNTDKQIRNYAKRAIKNGATPQQVLTDATTKFNQRFLEVNGHIYREDSGLHVVVPADYIRRHSAQQIM